MLSPSETVTFVIGIIMCAIGIASFVVGMTSRAKTDGALSNKVDNALKGIEEIKATISEQRAWREDIGLKLEGHTQQLSTLFRRVSVLEEESRYKRHFEQDEAYKMD